MSATDPSPTYRPAETRLQVVDCPVCGAGGHVPLQAAVDRWMGGVGVFAYARCLACGQVYLRERPTATAMADYYPPTYLRRGRGPASLRLWLRRRDWAPRTRLLRHLVGAGGRVLDVGCATGDFLVAARAEGLVPAGVEPSPWAARAASALGLPVWQSGLAEAPLPRAAFDAVTLWDVVEHLDAPLEALHAARRALRPGGVLLASTPVLDGWEARLYGAGWPGWDTPRHLQVFSRASLETLLERAGFEVERWAWLQESWLITALAASLAAKERWPTPAAEGLRRALHLRPLREAMRPTFHVLDRMLGGCAITVVARRPPEAPTAAVASSGVATVVPLPAEGSACG